MPSSPVDIGGGTVDDEEVGSELGKYSRCMRIWSSRTPFSNARNREREEGGRKGEMKKNKKPLEGKRIASYNHDATS